MITVRIRFEKTGEAAYISLLDLQRVFHRILKRSGLPVYYTQALTRISIFLCVPAVFGAGKPV